MFKNESFWTPLDNAAKIFPAIRSKEHSTVLRLSVVLKERVVIKHLFAAIALTEKRFPYFKVSLRKGFFWYYLEQVDHPVGARIEEGTPCQAFDDKKENGQLFRILAYKNRISVEFSHILTDGYGAFQFLKTLLFFFFKEKGIVCGIGDDDFYNLNVHAEELEDAYNRYFKENIPHVIQQPKAFHLPFPLKNKPRFDVLLAIISIVDLKKKSSDKQVSLTDYLVAVYLYVIQSIIVDLKTQRISAKNKIIRIQVPINLRNIYPSRTMRNFSLFLLPEIDLRLGHYSFDEILKIVYHKMRLETDEKFIDKIISRNVGGEKILFVRGIPLMIKNLVLKFKYYSEGTNQYSGVLTNLGKINLPTAISDHIEYFSVTPPPPNKKLKINCGVIGFQDKLVLSFGNITKSKELERNFIDFLVQEGFKVKLTKY